MHRRRRSIETRRASIKQAWAHSRPMGCTIPEAALRGITVPQLERIFEVAVHQCKQHRWRSTEPGRHAEVLTADTITLYDLAKYWIEPETQERKCSMVELIAAGPQPPEWFVSHWWGEPVKDFITCLRQHLKDRDLPLDTTAYWVCAYALRQHDLGIELAGGVRFSPFALARGTVSVVDKSGRYFRRIWCCYELYVSIIGHDASFLHDIYTAAEVPDVYGGRLRAVGLVDGFGAHDQDVTGTDSTEHKQRRESSFPKELVIESGMFNLNAAECTKASDRRLIMGEVGSESDILNYTLRCRFGSTRLADLLVEGADATQLDEVLAWLRNSRLRKLAAYCTAGYGSTSAIERLMEALPETLVELRAECLRKEALLGSLQLVAVGQLVHLELRACGVDADGAQRLGEALTSKSCKLKVLNLGNNHMGPAGAQALGQCLTRNTSLLDLNLMINNIGDDGAGALGESLKHNKTLTSLSLIFNIIGDEGAHRLAEGLRVNSTLTQLNMRINRTDSPGVASLRAAWLVYPDSRSLDGLSYDIDDTAQAEYNGARFDPDLENDGPDDDESVME